jgi:branched-chain amino acid transport system ATP-binding protein
MLTLEDIVTYYGNICALKGISLDVEQGEIVTIIGGNGAGKTTTLKTICGLVPATSGEVCFLDNDITNNPTSDIVGAGIVMVPEGRRVFPGCQCWKIFSWGHISTKIVWRLKKIWKRSTKKINNENK